MTSYECRVCGYVYDETKQGRKWSDLPDDWVCPGCGAPKSSFEPVGAQPQEPSRNCFQQGLRCTPRLRLHLPGDLRRAHVADGAATLELPDRVPGADRGPHEPGHGHRRDPASEDRHRAVLQAAGCPTGAGVGHVAAGRQRGADRDRGAAGVPGSPGHEPAVQRGELPAGRDAAGSGGVEQAESAGWPLRNRCGPDNRCSASSASSATICGRCSPGRGPRTHGVRPSAAWPTAPRC